MNKFNIRWPIHLRWLLDNSLEKMMLLKKKISLTYITVSTSCSEIFFKVRTMTGFREFVVNLKNDFRWFSTTVLASEVEFGKKFKAFFESIITASVFVSMVAFRVTDATSIRKATRVSPVTKEVSKIKIFYLFTQRTLPQTAIYELLHAEIGNRLWPLPISATRHNQVTPVSYHHSSISQMYA